MQDAPRQEVVDKSALSVAGKDASTDEAVTQTRQSTPPAVPQDQVAQLREQWAAIEKTAAADLPLALQQVQTLVKQVADGLTLNPALERYRAFFQRLLS